jgi:hypothetical protein
MQEMPAISSFPPALKSRTGRCWRTVQGFPNADKPLFKHKAGRVINPEREQINPQSGKNIHNILVLFSVLENKMASQ